MNEVQMELAKKMEMLAEERKNGCFYGKDARRSDKVKNGADKEAL